MPAAETSFTALRVEGGLFPAEFLARIAALEAPAQRPDDYDVPPGRTVRDEIGRYWTIAEALWKEYRSQSQREGHDRSRVGVERWMTRLLRDVFGYGDLTAASSRSVIGERSFPITHWAYGGKLPLLITTADHSLDKSDRLFGEDGRKRAPHATMQEFLNADTAVLWGVVTNGVRLRILRDNPSLTRPAFVEADFERIFDEGLYADFTALWLLLHASRFAPDAKGVAGTRLEAWRAEGAKTGQRALEKLRAGVTTALRELGTGFVENPANDALRIALRDGTLTADGLHQQLLRLVYRMLLLFTAEERDLLHPPEADADARDVYRDGYSLGRVRDRARFRRHYDRYGDLWAGLTTTFRALSRGSKPLGLPAMGGLFDPLLCPDLDKAELANSRLLAAVHALAYFTSDGALSRVNYRDMGTEELGSVYESLLELHPVVQVAERPWTFGFVGDDLGGSAKGNERKLSGSYYTPDSLVQELLRSALDPVIERTITENPGDPRAALLKLRVIDPACGSGHFLLGAARRLADAVARLDAESDLPDEAIRRHALREVVRRCIYGVDRNPLSVELCKTALWIEAIEPGKPLSFLDAHVKCGDSLVGVFDLKVLKDGIPDDAFKELTGDDKVYCRDLKKRNAAERKTPHLGFLSDASVPPALAAAFNALTELPEDTVEQVEEKAHALKRLQKGQATYDLKVACDLWCAAFFLPKAGKPEFVGRDLVPTTDTVWRYVRAPSTVYGPLIGATSEVAGRARFFHWPLEFPEAFAVGGFDCVLGNPPWETMSPDYKEFFSAFDEGIRHLSPQEQDIAFKSLLSDKMIATLWEEHCLSLYASVNFMKSSGRYRLFAEGNLGKGDFNVYRMFVETALALTRKERVAAQFVPEGLYNGANATAIRKEIFGAFRLSKIGGFENTRGIWFPSIDTRMKFCLYVAWKEGKTEDFFAAFNINSHDRLQAFSNEIGLRIPMSIIMDFSPETYSLLEFSSQREIDICARMYVKYPRFGENIAGYPFREYMREVDMGTDRKLFSEDESGLPVFEGRMIDAYDYRAKGYISGRGRAGVWSDFPFGFPEKSVKPQWRILREIVPGKLTGRVDRYRIGFGDVASPTNQRSLTATLLPRSSVSGHSVPTIEFSHDFPNYYLLWLGVANSLVMDFLVRQKVALHLAYTIMDSLPFPRDVRTTPYCKEIVRRVFSLSAVGPEMDEFREIAIHAGIVDEATKPIEDPLTRAVIDAQINVLVAREVFSLGKTDMLYILDPNNIADNKSGAETFRALRDYEQRVFGDYRTQRLILDAWDTDFL